MVREIRKLGDERLYEKSTPVTKQEQSLLADWITDLRDTLLDYRRTYGAGRAIAAPQIGIQKRLIYMQTDREYVFINPVLTFLDNEMFEVLDDCMSFPGLYVRVLRHKRANITYLDENFQPQNLEPEGDYSELLQHEYDHLDGILATQRAIDSKSFFYGKRQQ